MILLFFLGFFYFIWCCCLPLLLFRLYTGSTCHWYIFITAVCYWFYLSVAVLQLSCLQCCYWCFVSHWYVSTSGVISSVYWCYFVCYCCSFTIAGGYCCYFIWFYYISYHLVLAMINLVCNYPFEYLCLSLPFSMFS